MTVRIALVGCGVWGKNILRVLTESPRARLVAVADAHPARRAEAADRARTAAIVPSLDDALDLGVDAVAIATPAPTHASLVLRAIEAGAHVFVEKPLALTPADADLCVAAAAARGRIGMVGHLLRYHPAVVRLLDLTRSGALGELSAVESARFSTARDRSASALWTLGPHDFSVLHALDPSPIRAVSATSAPAGDPLRIEAELESGLAAKIALSGSHARKERRICVIGASKIAVLDDVRAPDRVLLAEPRRRRGASAAAVTTGEIAVPWYEPLAAEIEHFLCCVEDRARPLTPLEDGALVVRSLARAEASRAAAPAIAAGESLDAWL